MKTLIFAYSEFGCIGIEELLKAGYEIDCVFTYRDDPKETVYYRSVAKTCVEHGIRAYTFDKPEQAQWIARLQEMAPDYIFSFYFRELLPDSVLSIARKGAFNLHGSLLPRYRGRAPVNWVLVRGETETGVTLHHMVSRADAGDIVGQEKVAIAYEDTAFILQHKLLAATRKLLKEQLPLIASGKAARIRQDISKGEYCGRRTPADGRIDWSQPAETVRNLIRAVTQPYPGAFTYMGEQKIMIWDSAVDMQAKPAAPGTVIALNPFTIACGKGALIVKAGQIGEDGFYFSGVQLAEALKLSAGARFDATPAAA